MIENEGIVIKSIDYGDSNKIITLFTITGLKSLNVRGAQKPSSHTFNFAKEFILLKYEDRGKYLIGGKVENYYTNIINNIDLTKSTLRIFELINILVEHINNNEVAYKFLKQCLDLINNNVDHKLIELIFRIKFLYLIGLAPNFNACVNCGSKEGLVYFSLFDGGMKCNNCKNIIDYHLTKEELDLFRILYLVKLDKLIENINQIKYDYDDINKILNMFYSHFLGFESSVERIYKKIDR